MTITSRTIEDLLDIIETLVGHIKCNTHPDDKWLKDVNWMIYDVRQAMLQKEYCLDGVYTQDDIDELRDKIDELGDQLNDC